MEQNVLVKRLYVGGLDHTVSEAELKKRFCKFGNITDTEIVTRKDEKGKPTKTFAYISIAISEKELKKCISILNKTKWKGGTLQIELAKECFLHRLAQERQEAAEMKEKANCNGMTNVLESMKKSGVVDFHVKAVPGTEIPDHKDWVVGKFGRVLPVLHMKGQHSNKIMKYDPSKYCHNLKKLDSDFNETVPVSQLTWHLEEVDNIRSKKRQGQFPVSKKPPKKKMSVQEYERLNRTELKSRCQFSSKTNGHKTELVQNRTCTTKKYRKHSVNRKFVTESCRTINSLSESDIDTDEEIRAILANEQKVQKVDSNIEPEDDSMEVVGENFELKYSTHWSLKKAQCMEEVSNGELRSTENKSDYDSADTDEIIAVTQTSNQKKRGKETLNGSKATEEKDSRFKKGTLLHPAHSNSSDLNGSTSDKRKVGEMATPEKTNSEVVPKQSSGANECKAESDHLFLATSESEGDDDYETMMKNCYRLDLTLEDLEQLADRNAESTDDDTESNPSDTQSETNEFPVSNTKNIPRAPTDSPTPKKCICPEEILSAILEEESADEENPKEENSCLKVQPFKGIRSLSGNEAIKNLTNSELDAHKAKANFDSSDIIGIDSRMSMSGLQYLDSATKNPKSKLLSLRTINCDSHEGNCVLKPDGNFHREGSEVETSDGSVLTETKVSTNLKSFPKSAPREISCKGSVLEENLKNTPLKSRETKATLEKQQQDNKKRLAALQEKQKERELQKRLIQGALAHLELQSTNKQKHIVFDSDGESEAEVPVSTKEGSPGKLLGKDFTTKTSGKLFESSEDESDTAEEEDDRFKIKPQFEGKAGEKLMQLQSRFGTDERFRMDARFLESDTEPEGELKKPEIDEEEELALEKKKNLEILKNLLHINVEHPKSNKQAADARKFKDINTLRYDPTRQDHAVFERKSENTEKESKAKKKKKREEAQKLPEVSKEIFYNVAVNLRDVLESTKCDEKSEIIPWNKHSDVEKAIPADAGPLNLKDGSNKQEETSGFTFSFFGPEEETSAKEEPYVIETIKPSRVAWQEDPRFQDSSSDDEPEMVEREYVKEMSPATPHSNIRFFFFSQDDDRLKEGPKLFYRSSNLDEDRDDWESRREILLEDCRKKHKDARRKVKAKH